MYSERFTAWAVLIFPVFTPPHQKYPQESTLFTNFFVRLVSYSGCVTVANGSVWQETGRLQAGIAFVIAGSRLGRVRNGTGHRLCRFHAKISSAVLRFSDAVSRSRREVQMVRETVTGQYTLNMLEKCGLCKGSTRDEYISRIAVMRHFVENVWVGPE